MYDYEALANFAAELVIKNLRIPVLLVEGESTNYSNTRNYAGESLPSAFLNNKQLDALLKSPFEVTLFLDADFHVHTKNLLSVIDSFITSSNEFWALGNRNLSGLEGDFVTDHLYSVWSTLMLLKGHKVIERLVKHRYEYPTKGLYRNDHVVGSFAVSNYDSLHECSFPSDYLCTFTINDYSTTDSHALDRHEMNKKSLSRALENRNAQ